MTVRGPQWPDTLDPAALVRAGFRPQPFRQFVLKLTGRCDLACNYCYMFELADQGWRRRPARMSPEVVAAAARRIGEHAAAHGLSFVDVVLHGGEPLLAGAEGIDAVARQVRRHLPLSTRLALRVQTNGVRLDEPMLDVLAAHDIRVGVSVDGGRQHHDRHRLRPDGRGSYDDVRAGVERLRHRHPALFGGLLCTVDLENDPVATYEALLELSPPVVDLLLPHHTWASPPPGVPDPQRPGRPVPYGQWLAAVFDRWYPVAGRETGIRFFDELLQLLLGGSSRIEVLGLSPSAVVVVDTDGAIEQDDTLRAAFDGAPEVGLSVLDDTFDAALLHPGIVARQLGAAALCDTCRSCPLHRVCGGGYYSHRYRPGHGFLNPSVYCQDLQYIIKHVRARVVTDLAALPHAGTQVTAEA